MRKIVLIYNNIIKATNPYMFQALTAYCQEYNDCTKQLPDIQAGLVLHYFTLTQLENLHHFSNSCDNFWFNAIWHT